MTFIDSPPQLSMTITDANTPSPTARTHGRRRIQERGGFPNRIVTIPDEA
jgi:hypothetical protein